MSFLKAKYLSHKETIQNLVWRSFQLAGKQGIIFFIFILCSKLLNRNDFGIYNYILAAVFLLSMLGDFGISTATSKYVAEHYEVNREKVKLVFFNAGLLIACISIALIFITLLFGRFIFEDKFQYFLYVLPLVFLVPITSLFDGIYRGLKQFKKLSIISFFVGVVSFISSYFLVKKFGLQGALISQIVLYFFTLIGLFLGYSDHKYSIDKTVIKSISSYSFVYGLAVIGYYLFAKIDILILGHFGFLKEIATYELINKIFWVLLFPFAIVGQVVAPNFSRLSIRGEYDVIYAKLKRYTNFFFLLALVFSVLLYFIIPIIIKTFFKVYIDDIFVSIFPISLFIFFINVLASSVDSGIIVPTGFASIMTKAYLILSIINIILAFILLRYFGYIGVIWATLVSSVIMIIYVRINYFMTIKRLTSGKQ
jgi:O-antigen/teichoic acid export membrane protein